MMQLKFIFLRYWDSSFVAMKFARTTYVCRAAILAVVGSQEDGAGLIALTNEPTFGEEGRYSMLNFLIGVLLISRSGLPDFSWYNIPKRGELYQTTTKYIKWL
jgi:hypothetical protein